MNINLVVDYNDDNDKIHVSENGTWSDNEKIDVPENGPFSGIIPVLTPMANGKLMKFWLIGLSSSDQTLRWKC